MMKKLAPGRVARWIEILNLRVQLFPLGSTERLGCPLRLVGVPMAARGTLRFKLMFSPGGFWASLSSIGCPAITR